MIATDGSPFANQSLQYAAGLYNSLPEKPVVYIVNVVSDPMGVGREGLPKEVEQSEKLLRKEALRFSEKGTDDKNIRIVVEVGDPRKKLVELLKRLDVDHLFMGGADFSSSAVDITSGGITNYMLHNLSGMVTIVK
ncbi:universal stress protein [Balneolales bacterium ANBcel1]|nr:universal stress protein [Balneolales bacterium ANBcel1]